MVEHFQGELPPSLRLLTRPARFLPLGPALTLAVRRFARRRRGVFDRLGDYGGCSFLVKPSDLDLAFLVVPNGERAEIRTLAASAAAETTSDVTVEGPILVLLGLLDGTFDGDALFFNRAIKVRGRTDALLALRNAIEDAELKPSDLLGLGGEAARLFDRAFLKAIEAARRLTDAPVLGEAA